MEKWQTWLLKKGKVLSLAYLTPYAWCRWVLNNCFLMCWKMDALAPYCTFYVSLCCMWVTPQTSTVHTQVFSINFSFNEPFHHRNLLKVIHLTLNIFQIYNEHMYMSFIRWQKSLSKPTLKLIKLFMYVHVSIKCQQLYP